MVMAGLRVCHAHVLANPHIFVGHIHIELGAPVVITTSTAASWMFSLSNKKLTFITSNF